MTVGYDCGCKLLKLVDNFKFEESKLLALYCTKLRVVVTKSSSVITLVSWMLVSRGGVSSTVSSCVYCFSGLLLAFVVVGASTGQHEYINIELCVFMLGMGKKIKNKNFTQKS